MVQVSELESDADSADELEELAAAAAAAAGGDGDEGDGGGGGDGDDEDDGPSNEYVHVNENYYFLEYVIRALGVTHAFVSLCMLIAYYNLKVFRLNFSNLLVSYFNHRPFLLRFRWPSSSGRRK